jgi:hypothetical protein
LRFLYEFYTEPEHIRKELQEAYPELMQTLFKEPFEQWSARDTEGKIELLEDAVAKINVPQTVKNWSLDPASEQSLLAARKNREVFPEVEKLDEFVDQIEQVIVGSLTEKMPNSTKPSPAQRRKYSQWIASLKTIREKLVEITQATTLAALEMQVYNFVDLFNHSFIPLLKNDSELSALLPETVSKQLPESPGISYTEAIDYRLNNGPLRTNYYFYDLQSLGSNSHRLHLLLLLLAQSPEELDLLLRRRLPVVVLRESCLQMGLDIHVKSLRFLHGKWGIIDSGNRFSACQMMQTAG